jgi:acetaldehyde dehydrogenase
VTPVAIVGSAAAVPIVAAVSRAGTVSYAEIVSSISSRSADPETRNRLDQLIENTSAAIELAGGARRGKAVIILNPADPPAAPRNTVYCLVDGDTDHAAIEESIVATMAEVSTYVPGCRLKQRVQFETFTADSPLHVPETGAFVGTRVTTMLEVTGAGASS